MTRSVRPWCLKRRTSLIRRIDNLWVGIRLPHWLNEKPRSPVELSAEASGTAKTIAESLLTIHWNRCSPCGEIRAHDPANRGAPAKKPRHTAPELTTSRSPPENFSVRTDRVRILNRQV